MAIVKQGSRLERWNKALGVVESLRAHREVAGCGDYDAWFSVAETPGTFSVQRTVSPVELAEQMRLTSRVNFLEKQVDKLRLQIEKFEVAFLAKPTHATPESSGSVIDFLEIFRACKELFACDASVSTEHDPVEPELPIVTFTVTTQTDDLEDLVNRQLEWHRRVKATIPESKCIFRLNIEFCT